MHTTFVILPLIFAVILKIWLIRSFEVEERKGRIYFKVDNDEMILRHSRFTIIITSKDYKFFECTFVYYYSKD